MSGAAVLLLAADAEGLAFAEVAGRPVLIRTLEHFESHPGIESIVIVTSAAAKQRVEELVSTGFTKISAVLEGGETSGACVHRGLQNLGERLGDDDIVLVHEATRPHLDADLITANIEMARKRGAAVTVEPFADSVVWVDPESGQIHRVPPRRELYAARMPQSFRFATILDIYTWAQANGVGSHDPAHLSAICGLKPSVVPSTPANFKIARPIDLALAEGMARSC